MSKKYKAIPRRTEEENEKIYAPVVSKHRRLIPAQYYNPPGKAPSRKDLHRMAVAERKGK